MARHRRSSGFTLIELLVVITIVGIVLAMAVPAMDNFVRNNRAEVQLSSFTTSLSYARAEAIIRRTEVVVSPVAGGTSWEGGWLIWVDSDADNTPDAGEVLQSVEAWVAGATLTSGEDQVNVRFDSRGGAAETVDLAYRMGDDHCRLERNVSVSRMGRVTVQRRDCE